MKNIKIIVAAHKKYKMPDGTIYLPLHVGAEGKEPIGYNKDNEGENISALNPYFCELTGLYWAWKNLQFDYIGLAHYRRHFSFKRKGDKWHSVLNDTEAQQLCQNYDIILPAKRRYYIETLYSHYAHTFDAKHLDATGEILQEKFPDYIPFFDKVVKQTSGYMFNMFIMKKELVSDYCSFLFPLLFDLQQRVEYKNLSPFHARLFGRVSEIIFNVWLAKKMADDRNLRVKVIGTLHMESINWWQKGWQFLAAKFLGKKYC